MSLERKILNFMDSGNRFKASTLKKHLSDKFDEGKEEIEDAIRKLEKNGDVYRPRKGRLKRLNN